MNHEIENGIVQDFIALLNYYPGEISGRKAPAYSGYRPTVKFAFSDMQTSGQQVFIGKGEVHPGDTVNAYINLATKHIFKSCLKIGMEFDFREGGNIIGTGRIVEILNDELISK